MLLSNILKFKFYTFLFLFKIFAPLECKNYRLLIFIAEIVFPFQRMKPLLNIVNPKKYHEIILKTNFGKFLIRKILIDLVIASPSFERPDLMKLISLMQQSLEKGKKILFIDIGADFGKYTITVGNHFKEYSSNLKIISFEPEVISYNLLKKNIKLNKLTNVTIFNKALSDKKALRHFYIEETMNMLISFKIYSSKSIRVATQKLDNYISYLNTKHDEIFIKLDVEGHEIEVLKGGIKFMQKAKKVTLLVEDSSIYRANKLLQFLKKEWTFITKRTLYNSFWESRNYETR